MTPENIYIQSVLLNGKEYNKLYIRHQDIMEGAYAETNKNLNDWVAVNPFGVVHGDSEFKDIRPQDSEVNSLNMSLGLDTDEVATAKLDVNGNVRVRKNMKVEGSDTVGQNLVVNGATMLKQTLQVDGKYL